MVLVHTLCVASRACRYDDDNEDEENQLPGSQWMSSGGEQQQEQLQELVAFAAFGTGGGNVDDPEGGGRCGGKANPNPYPRKRGEEGGPTVADVRWQSVSSSGRMTGSVCGRLGRHRPFVQKLMALLPPHVPLLHCRWQWCRRRWGGGAHITPAGSRWWRRRGR